MVGKFGRSVNEGFEHAARNFFLSRKFLKDMVQI